MIMASYIIRRLLLSIFTVWVISVFAFIVIEAPPGDKLEKWFDYRTTWGIAFDQEAIKNLSTQFGMNQPKHVRYAKWMWGLLRGDLGVSFDSWDTLTSTRDVIGDRLWLTVILTAFTIIFTWTISIPIGIYSAVRQHSIGDYAATFVGFAGLAVPDFLLALWLLWVSFAYFGQSIGGLLDPEYLNAPWSLARVQNLISHLWIAAFVVGTAGTAALVRVMRANLLDELNRPYVITARAKGLPEWKVILKYPVRLALNPLVSTLGYLLPFLISGSIIVSVVLNLPTEGPLLLRALLVEDMFISATIVLVLGAMTVIGTFLSDVLLSFIDPRIRLN